MSLVGWEMCGAAAGPGVRALEGPSGEVMVTWLGLGLGLGLGLRLGLAMVRWCASEWVR